MGSLSYWNHTENLNCPTKFHCVNTPNNFCDCLMGSDVEYVCKVKVTKSKLLINHSLSVDEYNSCEGNPNEKRRNYPHGNGNCDLCILRGNYYNKYTFIHHTNENDCFHKYEYNEQSLEAFSAQSQSTLQSHPHNHQQLLHWIPCI